MWKHFDYNIKYICVAQMRCTFSSVCLKLLVLTVSPPDLSLSLVCPLSFLALFSLGIPPFLYFSLPFHEWIIHLAPWTLLAVSASPITIIGSHLVITSRLVLRSPYSGWVHPLELGLFQGLFPLCSRKDLKHFILSYILKRPPLLPTCLVDKKE